MKHIVLLGDSIFDNASYVPGGPDVETQLRQQLPPGWRSTLLAVDGSVTSDIRSHLARVPPDATHLVLSVGGNDALGCSGVLTEHCRTVAEALMKLADLRASFAASYRQTLEGVLGLGLPLIACTIYNPAYSDLTTQRVTSTALTVFNDAILCMLIERRLAIIDLRLVCNEPTDYANPIEPGVCGGAKIAAAILRAVQSHSWPSQASAVYD